MREQFHVPLTLWMKNVNTPIKMKRKHPDIANRYDLSLFCAGGCNVGTLSSVQERCGYLRKKWRLCDGNLVDKCLTIYFT